MAEIGETRKKGGLLKTGQTTQYGGYEDDGYFEKGLSKRYTILTAGQHAGTTSITVATKTDLISNNCVYDQRTKLMWSRYPTDALGPSDDGRMPWTTDGNGHGIFAFVAAANAAKLGGYADWRVPNDLELPSLRDMEAPNAKPDETAFPSFPITDRIWCSTTMPVVVTMAMHAFFNYGSISFDDKGDTNFILPVRGGWL